MNWNSFYNRHNRSLSRLALSGISAGLLVGCPTQTPPMRSIAPIAFDFAEPPVSQVPQPEVFATPVPFGLEPSAVVASQATPHALLQFGPGSKGLETRFGPGSKGLNNLVFYINFQPQLVRKDLQAFQTQQFSNFPLIQKLRIELVRENQLYAQATVLPALPLVTFGTRIHPGRYSLRTLIENQKASPLLLSWRALEITETMGNRVRIDVFAGGQKPEDLDVSVQSQTLPLEPSAEGQSPQPVASTAESPAVVGVAPSPTP
jgi:hypothetical protein